MATAPRLETTFSAIFNNRPLAGNIKEFTPPTVKLKTEDVMAAGLDQPFPIEMGLEKLEASITLTAIEAQHLALFGLIGGNSGSLIITALSQGGGVTRRVEYEMTGSITEHDPGDRKINAASEHKLGMWVKRYRMMDGDQVIYDIDTLNMKRVINGVDQLAKARNILRL